MIVGREQSTFSSPLPPTHPLNKAKQKKRKGRKEGRKKER